MCEIWLRSYTASLSGGRAISVTAASPVPSGLPPPDIPLPLCGTLSASLLCLMAVSGPAVRASHVFFFFSCKSWCNLFRCCRNKTSKKKVKVFFMFVWILFFHWSNNLKEKNLIQVSVPQILQGSFEANTYALMLRSGTGRTESTQQRGHTFWF